MSTLFDVLIGDSAPPDHVVVGGVCYPIVTDFRHWMRVESRLMDSSVDESIKGAMLLTSFLPDYKGGKIDPARGFPFPADEGIAALVEFCMHTDAIPDDKKSKKKNHSGRKERGYDYRHDIGLIYAAFLSTYGVNLTTVNMHWWVFKALFYALPDGTVMRALMEARMANCEKPTEAQKEAKEAAALPEHIRYYDTKKGYSAAYDDSWVESIKARKQK